MRYHQTLRLRSLYVGTGMLLALTGCSSIEESSFEGEEESVGLSSPTYARNTVSPDQVDHQVDEAESAYEAQINNEKLRIASPLSSLVAADGRVYNVTGTVNIRKCAGTNSAICPVVWIANAGADLENDASGGITTKDGYNWVRVVYGYSSSDACSTSQLKGYVIVNSLAPGAAHVTAGPLNIRSSPCNGSIITTVNAGTTLSWYQGDNQWSSKWYEIVVPGSFFQAGWVDGWDFTDVY